MYELSPPPRLQMATGEEEIKPSEKGRFLK